jgi:hypothetical protein
MKKLFLCTILSSFIFSNTSSAQGRNKPKQSILLTTYLQLKDNLVKSDSTAARLAARDLVVLFKESVLNIPVNIKSSILIEAEAMSISDDLQMQRAKMPALSELMFTLAKQISLTHQPIYQQYCSMQNATWLSLEKEINNPYYGSEMLICGEVKATL